MDLAPMLAASSVAVIGASSKPGSVGATTVAELLSGGFTGRVYPVNPRHRELAGLACYPSLLDLPEAVDLAVVAVANAGIESQLSLAAQTGARSAVIFASAFEEPVEGLCPLTERLASLAAKTGMALCGANCMGFVNTTVSLRACGYVLPRELGPGPISLISASGSSFSAVLCNDRGLRFNLAVSPGQELVTTSADYLSYCLDLEGTRAVGLLIEQVRDPAGFSAAMHKAHLRDVAVVALKVGVIPHARQLVAAHSGALAGDDGAYEAFFDSLGVHRVSTLDELANTLELLASPRRAPSGGLAAVTDSGGERALLVDLAAGLAFAEPAPGTTARLAGLLDPGLDPVNPTDAWGTGTDAERVFSESLRALHDDDDTAAVLFAVNLNGNSGKLYGSVATTIADSTSKPFALLTNYPGGMNRQTAAQLRASGVPVLEGTDRGLEAVRHLFAHRDFRNRPPLEPPDAAPREVLDRWRARLADPVPLREAEALSLAESFGIPVARTVAVSDEHAAVEAAQELGWPVALKTASPGIAHKSDVGGVILGLRGPDDLRDAYRVLASRLGPRATVQRMAPRGVELALGVVHDPGFGPLVVVGAGGTLVELLGDRRVALPPLDSWRARRLLDGLRLRPLLAGVRGQEPADLDAVVDSLVRISGLARDLSGHLDALDVNPLVATPTGCVAVDALAFGRAAGAPAVAVGPAG